MGKGGGKAVLGLGAILSLALLDFCSVCLVHGEWCGTDGQTVLIGGKSYDGNILYAACSFGGGTHLLLALVV